MITSFSFSFYLCFFYVTLLSCLQIEQLEEKKDEEQGSFVRKRWTNIPPILVDAQPQVIDEMVEPVHQEDEQSPSLVVAFILGKLASQEEVTGFESSAGG